MDNRSSHPFSWRIVEFAHAIPLEPLDTGDEPPDTPCMVGFTLCRWWICDEVVRELIP